LFLDVEQMDVSGIVMDVSGLYPYGAPTGPPPPDVLTLSDLLADQDLVLAKEAVDRNRLESIGSQSVQALKPKLLEWLMKGKPDGFPILQLEIVPPVQCSDGVHRSLPDYIEFCSGKTIQEHVGLLQAKLPDILVSFANIGGMVSVTVLKV
jgi:hypothetical protein